jgi:glucose-6-phosphate-specific signal transduction histidine kinase
MGPYYYNILPYDSKYNISLKTTNTQEYNLTNTQFLNRPVNLKLIHIVWILYYIIINVVLALKI